MKNSSVLTSLLILAAIIISSCSQNMSLTKRRYTKGYFVERHGKHRSESQAKVHEKKSQTESIQAMKVADEVRKSRLAKVENVKNIPQPGQVTASGAGAETKKAGAAPDKVKLTRQQKKDLVKLMYKNPVKAIRSLPEQLGTAATADDALSLLWVVIVVLLIVYLLSFLFDSFGAGSLIHILGVIIVVLLILWLLRIL